MAAASAQLANVPDICYQILTYSTMYMLTATSCLYYQAHVMGYHLPVIQGLCHKIEAFYCAWCMQSDTMKLMYKVHAIRHKLSDVRVTYCTR